MAEKKEYQIKVQGQLVPVTEEVYLTYYRMKRRELHLEEKDAAHGVFYYSALDTEETKVKKSCGGISEANKYKFSSMPLSLRNSLNNLLKYLITPPIETPFLRCSKIVYASLALNCSSFIVIASTPFRMRLNSPNKPISLNTRQNSRSDFAVSHSANPIAKQMRVKTNIKFVIVPIMVPLTIFANLHTRLKIVSAAMIGKSMILSKILIFSSSLKVPVLT